ncbi:MAG: hypothetical protein J6K19_07510 [Prevotella sp.]|nr:hypothetical protein [Prevotella sp.]
MKNKVLFTVIAAAALTSACNNKAQQEAPVSQADTLETVEDKNATVFGMCGDGSAMNTLQLIADNGDTLVLGLEEAHENNKVFGGYGCGDRMAVVLNDDKTEAELVINETTLLGNWLMPNPFDGSSVVGISLKDGGVAESIDQSGLNYKSWKIADGKLEIVSVREGGSEEDETDIYEIRKLDADSLVFGNEDDVFEYGRQK